MKKIHIRTLCFFWPLYLLFFLFSSYKIMLAIAGIFGLTTIIIRIKKNKNNDFEKIQNSLFAIIYCLIIIFGIFLFVRLTKIEAFNWLYFSTLCVIDHHFFYFINWTPWKKKKKKEKGNKSKTREWIESVLFAIFAATLIHIFTIQPYIIPTSSLEGSLLRGDFLFVSKFNYGSNVPNTPLFLPFMHNTLPFTTNTPSYLDWIQLGYNRLPGFQKIKNNDIVVFNWPTDDTRPNMPFDKKLNYVKRCLAIPGDSLKLIDGKVEINGHITKWAWLPQEDPNRGEIQHAYWIQYDKKNVYKKWKEIRKELHNKYEVELTSIGGEIIESFNQKQDDWDVKYYTDLIVHGSEKEIDRMKEDADSIIRITQNIICASELTYDPQEGIKRPCSNDSLYNINNRIFSKIFPRYTLDKYNLGPATNLPEDNIESDFEKIKTVDILGYESTSLFPQPFEYEVTFKESNENCSDTSSNILQNKTDVKKKILFEHPHNWDSDNYGPIYMPKEGDEITLTKENIALYVDIIKNYENNTLEIIYQTDCATLKDDEYNQGEWKFIINGKETNKYTIQMDQGYYWMMGDNRHNSQDSRCWGYVPFSHVVGKPLLVWLSIDWNADSLLKKIRWKRLFTTVHGDGESRWYFPHFLVLLILFMFRKRIKKLIKYILNKKQKNLDQTPD